MIAEREGCKASRRYYSSGTQDASRVHQELRSGVRMKEIRHCQPEKLSAICSKFKGEVDNRS